MQNQGKQRRGALNFTLSSLSLGGDFDLNDTDPTVDLLDDVFGCMPTTLEVLAIEENLTKEKKLTQELARTISQNALTSASSASLLGDHRHTDNDNDNDNARKISTVSLPGTIESTPVPVLPDLSLRDMKQLGLNQTNVDHLKDIFLTLHLHTDGTIDINGFHNFFNLSKSPWSARIFSYLDTSNTGSADFIEWVAFTTHICTANEDGLARMVFSVYDDTRTNMLDTARVVQLLHDVHAGGGGGSGGGGVGGEGGGGGNESDKEKRALPWSSNYVGEKVGQSIATFPLDPITGTLTLNGFCNACQYNSFVLQPIHELAKQMIEQVGGGVFWQNIIARARTHASSTVMKSLGGAETEKVEMGVGEHANQTDKQYVSAYGIPLPHEVAEETNTGTAEQVKDATLQSIAKSVHSTNWFHRFGLRYEKGGFLIPWTTSPTDKFIKTLKQHHSIHHEHKHGHTEHSKYSHHSHLVPLLTPTTSPLAKPTNNPTQHTATKHAATNTAQPSSSSNLENRMAVLEQKLLQYANVTSPPPDLQHPKHFYNRVRPQTASDRRGETVRNNALKTHVQQVLGDVSVSTTRRRRRPHSAKPRQRTSRQSAPKLNRGHQQLAFKKLTRTWKKTPCFFCGLEGHLVKQCKRAKQAHKKKAIQKKMQKHGIPRQSKLSNRIVLSSMKARSASSTNALMSHITGGMNSTKRSQLLAFAVKKSLIEAVSWADQARYTGAAMENARRAAKRHHRAHLLKDRQEKTQQLRPREMGLF